MRFEVSYCRCRMNPVREIEYAVRVCRGDLGVERSTAGPLLKKLKEKIDKHAPQRLGKTSLSCRVGTGGEILYFAVDDRIKDCPPLRDLIGWIQWQDPQDL